MRREGSKRDESNPTMWIIVVIVVVLTLCALLGI